ncbi:putative RNA recognition motif protein [Toxoplasma gondii RUB]|uniref:Putative RNA recognition motif protein n=1 Tax=Toxoplasma gondii RUB TaxID=935652 RepID=A0A086LZ80_TOXGO|nr:putative RNA recognition motif protein [Toxoplasma gondii RUB]
MMMPTVGSVGAAGGLTSMAGTSPGSMVNSAQAGAAAATAILAGRTGAADPSNLAGLLSTSQTAVLTPEQQQMQQQLLQQQQQMANNRVYIGNVPFGFSSEDLKKIFVVFGPILSCQLLPSQENPQQHRGYGFIEYATADAAKLAIETMNGFEVAVRARLACRGSLRGPWALRSLLACTRTALCIAFDLRVLQGTRQAAEGELCDGDAEQPCSGDSSRGQSASLHGRSSGGLAPDRGSRPRRQACRRGLGRDRGRRPRGPGAPAAASPAAPAPGLSPATSTGTGASAPAINGRSQSGDRDGEEKEEEDLPPAPAPADIRSPVVLLSNMVTPSEVDGELKDEVREECSKFGSIKRVEVHTLKETVRIFVEFSDLSGAREAIPSLHGRWFGGRQIIANTYDQELFHQGEYEA